MDLAYASTHEQPKGLGLHAVVLRRELGELFMLNSHEVAVALLGMTGKDFTIISDYVSSGKIEISR
jgi:hypothetical protein